MKELSKFAKESLKKKSKQKSNFTEQSSKFSKSPISKHQKPSLDIKKSYNKLPVNQLSNFSNIKNDLSKDKLQVENRMKLKRDSLKIDTTSGESKNSQDKKKIVISKRNIYKQNKVESIDNFNM